jgi:hypothetical protein
MDSAADRPLATPAPAVPIAEPGVRPLTPGMRLMLLVASLLVFLVGVQLFILTEDTDHWFAWTITPPLTAAFLGGSYWASFALEWLASRERSWARARVAVPAVLSFTTLTLIASLIHLDKFHLSRPQFETVAATWIWLAVYGLVPIIMSLLLVQQLRVPGGDPPGTRPMAPAAALGLMAAGSAMAVLGVALFVAPEVTKGIWPWTLTPLTARAVGAWLIGLGIATAHAGREADWGRVRPGAMGLAVFGALQLVALARYAATPQWGTPSAWVYLLAVIAALAIGLYGLWAARRA